MKFNNKAILALCGGILLASCTTDAVYDGGYITEEKKSEVLDLDPSRLASEITGLMGYFSMQHSVIGTGSARLDDVAYPGMCMRYDFESADMVGTPNGTDWFSTSGDYTSRTPNYYNPVIVWRWYYAQIKMANDIIAAIDPETENETSKGYLGQAHIVRALDYFNLAQAYQFNYVGNEDKPCVPLVLETTTTGDNPRASVAEVYEQVYYDINRAVELLDGYSRPAKNFADKYVALALRARINLVCQRYDEAYEDATTVINEGGFSPIPMAEITAPDTGNSWFNNAQCNAWIWGVIMTSTDMLTGYQDRSYVGSLHSLTSMSFTASFQQYVRANVLLYDKIPSSDVRKAWWLDTDLNSPIINGKSWKGYEGQDIRTLVISDVKTEFLPYSNVKFGPANNVIGSEENTCDFPIIRIEEMYLIQAEAAAFRSGGSVGTGASLLESFVKQYRNPNYTCTASSREAFINAVWFQRRVELWGEGFGLLDALRLNKNVVRVKAGTPSNFATLMQFNIAADNPILLSVIPQSEINANNAISDADNNNGVIPATGDGAGLTDGCVVE